METRRLGRTEHQSSILIFGSFALYHLDQKESDAAIEMAFEHGVNHIDVSPIYGAAEERIGSWIKRNGRKFFMACKTHERTKEAARESLHRSLETLNVDYFDLFQFHGVDSAEAQDTILGPGGAMEAVLEARELGLVRYIGVTGHSPVVHNEFLRKFDFDTILFPLNRVHAANFTDWNDWRPLLKTAKEKDTGLMAIKAVAKQAWPGSDHKGYNTWYEPFDDPDNIEKSVRYALSQDITAAVLPGELSLWPMILDAAERFTPLSPEEEAAVVREASVYSPLVGPNMG
jgi:aryl-alcohol dehydrogenase-like predicted oxidoreductase